MTFQLLPPKRTQGGGVKISGPCRGCLPEVPDGPQLSVELLHSFFC